MSDATQTVQILMDGKLVDVEGRIIAAGLAFTPSMYHEGWSCISHLASGKAVMSARCSEHIEEAARLFAGHPVPIDWTRPEAEIIADEAVKDFVNAVSEAVGRCYDCEAKYDGPTWSVRCSTCDWQWDDENDSEGPLSFEEARDMARDHECEPNVELLPPGDGAKWVPEWRFKRDGSIATAVPR